MRPSGEKATEWQRLYFSELRGARVAASHSRTTPSAPPVAMVVPSGENATDATPRAGTRSVPSLRRVATSHRMTAPGDDSSSSPVAAATVRPSGENWTQVIDIGSGRERA